MLLEEDKTISSTEQVNQEIGAVGATGETALIIALRHWNGNNAIIHKLLSHGAIIDLYTADGTNALNVCAENIGKYGKKALDGGDAYTTLKLTCKEQEDQSANNVRRMKAWKEAGVKLYYRVPSKLRKCTAQWLDKSWMKRPIRQGKTPLI